MPEKRTCDGCGKEYWWPGAKFWHERCSPVGSVPVVAGPDVRVPVGAARSKNRRSRADYNAYQREYMRKTRKAKKAKP